MKAWFRRWSSVFETAMFRRKNRVIRFLKDKLQEAVHYGNYHKGIGKLIKKRFYLCFFRYTAGVV